jgi:hypothetical protein
MGRLKDILDSMIKMDIIEKTDSAGFTCPIILVMDSLSSAHCILAHDGTPPHGWIRNWATYLRRWE